MIGGKQPRGFTIFEAMIFLAISGVLLGVAVSLIGGKVNDTEFNQGIRQVQSDLQAQVSHVAQGYYMNNGNFSCSEQLTGSILITNASPKSEGTNLGCQLIGEAIQFSPGTQSTQYVIYPIAGAQYSDPTSLTPITTIAAASPCAIATGSGTICDSTFDDRQTVTLPYGITVASASMGSTQPLSGSKTPGMLGLFSITSTTDIASSTNPQAVNGGGSVDLVPFTNDSLAESTTTAVQDIDSAYSHDMSTYYPAPSSYNQPVTLCFNSGTTNQSGLITIGVANNPTAVDLKIQGNLCP